MRYLKNVNSSNFKNNSIIYNKLTIFTQKNNNFAKQITPMKHAKTNYYEKKDSIFTILHFYPHRHFM